MILVTRFKKSEDGVCEITFEVGEKAAESAARITATCLRTAEALGATLTTMEKTAVNLRAEAQEMRMQLTMLMEDKLNQIPFKETDGIKFYSSILNGLDERWLMKEAGELVKQAGIAVLLAHKGDKGFIVLCRSSDLSFNSNQLFQHVVKAHGGKGGGRPEFASGVVPIDRLEAAFTDLRNACGLNSSARSQKGFKPTHYT